MTLEGLHEFEMLRDYLYTKMRGVRSHAAPAPAASPEAAGLAATLSEVASELRAVTSALERLLEKR
jgi:putative membrane protein